VGVLAALVAANVLGLDVSVSDTRDDRLQRALSLGLARSQPDVRYPYVIEATGTPGGLRHAHASLASGGSMLLIGLTGRSEVPMSIDEMVVGDQVWTGSLSSPGVWPEVIELVERGTIRPSTLITHRYPLDEAIAAFEEVRRASPGTGKVVIVPTSE
jgi:L-idonate 5-dehydrogenase